MIAPIAAERVETVPLMRRDVEPRIVLLLFAVVIAGFAAAVRGGFTLAWLLTPAVMLLILKAAVQSAPSPAPGLVEWPELPAPLRRVVRATLEQLAEGDARRLLTAVLAQARPLYAARETAFDPTQDAASRQNASDLLAACCATAVELTRIDAAMASSGASSAGVAERADTGARYKTARDLFARRLADAASALAALYASDVEHGTPASDRVAELAAEINADAKARSLAANEMSGLIAEPPQESSTTSGK